MDNAIVTDHIVPAQGAGTDGRRTPQSRAGHFAWVDIRTVSDTQREAVVDAAIHQGVDAIISDDVDQLVALPPTIRRVLALRGELPEDADLTAVDLVIAPDRDVLATLPTDVEPERGIHVTVSDAPTLQTACEVVREVGWTTLTFTDPTKIPLEIVIAAAENTGNRIVTTVEDIEDAEIVKLVLEHGSDGLLLAPRNADDVLKLAEIVRPQADRMELTEVVVSKVEHIGMGDRACIDTCSLLEKDEGCLIGSFSTGMFLSCSETHPLPYMPTRPFRWNAGAVHSYVLGPENRTRYVSELQAGMPVLAVRTDGSVREVRIGRVKIEKRPLISINAVAPNGRTMNLIAQDDWHVRLLGPGGSVNNVTELQPGDKLLAYVPSEARHVGLPITEFCDER
ncbi:3-dehydroquinate synthase II family protein [Gordonia aurantiaca]|uniref:3-dehydroquinate synthase II family protein n=1 Tax=Gordonia sp. B21 TaxID=3151852 RepID=UPI00326307BF